MTLYSPSFTSNPRKAVNVEYRRPIECGKRTSCVRRIPQPLADPMVAVAHSPTPSTVRMPASSNGEQKKALAAWERWCSEKRILSRGTPSRSVMSALTHSLSESHVSVASRKTGSARGNICSEVIKIRSNLTKGFSKKAT